MDNNKSIELQAASGHSSSTLTVTDEDVKLEALADTFQENLFLQGLVQDRHQRSKTVAKAFLGSEAVTVLLEILEHQADSPSKVTREEALQLGLEIQNHFGFFAHTKSTNKKKELPLKDSDGDLYHFQKNLPVQVHRMKKEYPSWWDKTRLLEKHVQVKSFKGIVRVYKDAFQAKDAVDALMDFKLVCSRKEAVHVMRKLIEKVHCCQPVDSNNPDSKKFCDNAGLYRFVPLDQRMPEPVKRVARRRDSINSSQHSMPVKRKPVARRSSIKSSFQDSMSAKRQPSSSSSNGKRLPMRRQKSRSCPELAGKKCGSEDECEGKGNSRWSVRKSALQGSASSSGTFDPDNWANQSVQSIHRDLLSGPGHKVAPTKASQPKSISKRGSLGSKSSTSNSASSPPSVKKDAAYFRGRASDIRSRLDVYREERGAANASLKAALNAAA